MSSSADQKKVAVITGAGGTLCSEMARALAKDGYAVALLGRTLQKLKIVQDEIVKTGGVAISVSADVSSMEAMRAAYDEVKKQLGPCSVLINGAGGNQKEAITTVDSYDPNELDDNFTETGFFNLSLDAFGSVLTTNTMGTVIPCQLFARDMARCGGGNIVNIASMNSFRPLSRVAAYGMAKAGIASFTQWLACYLAPAGIRVNAIAPGFFLNERSRFRLTTPDGGLTPRGNNVINHTPLKTFGEAPQLIGTLKWLIDNEASGFVTGLTVPVDGGFLACTGV